MKNICIKYTPHKRLIKYGTVFPRKQSISGLSIGMSNGLIHKIAIAFLSTRSIFQSDGDANAMIFPFVYQWDHIHIGRVYRMLN